MTPSSKRRPALDGIRALAVLAVFLSHTGVKHFAGGWIGVEVFFVLSGYLITGLLLTEWQRTHDLGLTRFYGRRAVRLYPALLLLVMLGIPFHVWLGDTQHAFGYVRTAGASLFYLEDLICGLTGSSHGGFAHTWSLAIEEQFYLLWPVCFGILMRHGRNVAVWTAGGAFLSLACTAIVSQAGSTGVPNVYFMPYTQASTLLAGCTLAVCLPAHATPSKWAASVLPSVALGGLVGLTVLQDANWRNRNLALGLTCASVLSVVAILCVETDGQAWTARVLSWRPLCELGRISYGFYLFHLPVLTVLPHVWPARRAFELPIAFTITLALSVASYRFFELPVQRHWNDRLSSGQWSQGPKGADANPGNQL